MQFLVEFSFKLLELEYYYVLTLKIGSINSTLSIIAY